jgi:hypothetical protein
MNKILMRPNPITGKFANAKNENNIERNACLGISLL